MNRVTPKTNKTWKPQQPIKIWTQTANHEIWQSLTQIMIPAIRQTVNSKSDKPRTLQPSITNESDPYQQLRDSSELAKLNQNHKPIHQPTKCNTATNRETRIKPTLKPQPSKRPIWPQQPTTSSSRAKKRKSTHNQIWHQQPTAKFVRA